MTLGYPVTFPVADWRRQAACVGEDPRYWDIDLPEHWADAIEICKRCPVQIDCYREHRGQYHASGVYAAIPLEHGEPVDRKRR